MELHKMNFETKLRNLIKSKYAKNTDFYKDFFDKTNVDIEKKCKQWLAGNNFPTIESAIKICDFFGCDLEYLFTEQNEFSRNVSDLALELGLDYDTIKAIQSLSLEEKHIIDAMFNTRFFQEKLIKSMQEMLYYAHSKNKTYIKLDTALTQKDKNFKDLEQLINENDLIDIFSNRLVIEMHNLLEALYQDKTLCNEISLYYSKKYFTSHKKTLTADELPQLSPDGSLNSKREIELLEDKILKRLEEREKIGNHWPYKCEKIQTSSDLSRIMSEFRNNHNITEDEYLKKLQYIDEITK